jgi:hypothetical protein
MWRLLGRSRPLAPLGLKAQDTAIEEIMSVGDRFQGSKE